MSQSVWESPHRQAFYAKIDRDSLSALWRVMGTLMSSQPGSGCQPHLWRFDMIRSHMLEAGRLISAKEAERRVLILENPGLRGQAKITTSLYAGVQLVLPGDIAPAHRHSQSALRLILEGNGAHTTVAGDRTVLAPGDLVITPSMTWHDHGNGTGEPMFWLDGLDIPVIQLFDASFTEALGADEQPITRASGDGYARYGHNLLPVDWKPPRKASPLVNYSYARTREALETMRRNEHCDPCHGFKLRYINPVSGDYVMPTLGAFVQLLPKGFATSRYRSTDATVFAVVEGHGHTRIGDHLFEWGPKDVFVAPSWHWMAHEVPEEAVLFSFSDRPIQEKLDILREDRGNT